MQFNLSEIDFLSSATRAFVTNQEDLKNLFGDNHPFYHIKDAIRLKSEFNANNRKILVEELNQFYNLQLSDEFISDKVLNNIESLKKRNTYTVTTGQQLHPCLGPALVLYKIMDVIIASEIYNIEFPEYHFVPIFWMASEDHDYDEVKTIKIYNKEFTWQTQQNGAVGRFHTEEFTSFFEDLTSKLNLNESAKELVLKAKEFYTKSKTLSQATAKLVNYLFGNKGLIVLEPDNKNLKGLFKSVMVDDIKNQITNEAFQLFSEKLKTQNLSLQLNSREINFFYLLDGMRKRVVVENGIFKVLDTEIEFSELEILESINKYPERFSPNAVLRPLYQETILPNVSYIGGNAEINYWLQLKGVFEAHHINPPHLKLRSSYWIMNQTQSNWLKENKINPIELLKSDDKQDRYKLINLPKSEYLNFLNQFSELKTQILDYTSKVKLNELHAISEKSKEYEKLLKKVNTAFEEKSVKENEFIINKLDKIYYQNFDLNNIQERHQTVLELYINCNTIVDFLSNIHAKFINNAQIITL